MQQIPEITTLTINSSTILETMDILRKLVMKGNLSVDERAETWKAYNTLQQSILESPEFKEQCA